MIEKSTHNIRDFISNLHELCVEYGIYPDGQLRLRQGKEWDITTFNVSKVESVNYGYACDKSGPFLSLSIQPVEIVQTFTGKKSRITIADKDILLRDGIKSQADGKMYSNRREYNDHLKRNNVVEVGDQAPTKAPQEIRGDFDCRKELREAIKQHIG